MTYVSHSFPNTDQFWSCISLLTIGEGYQLTEVGKNWHFEKEGSTLVLESVEGVKDIFCLIVCEEGTQSPIATFYLPEEADMELYFAKAKKKVTFFRVMLKERYFQTKLANIIKCAFN